MNTPTGRDRKKLEFSLLQKKENEQKQFAYARILRTHNEKSPLTIECSIPT